MRSPLTCALVAENQRLNDVADGAGCVVATGCGHSTAATLGFSWRKARQRKALVIGERDTAVEE